MGIVDPVGMKAAAVSLPVEVIAAAPTVPVNVGPAVVVYVEPVPLFKAVSVATIVPDPDVAREPPVPTTIAAVVFVAPVILLKAVLLPLANPERQLNPTPADHAMALPTTLQSGIDRPVGATAVREPRIWLALSAVVSVPAVVAVDALPVRAPENVVVARVPVDGLYVNFADVVFCGRFPVFAVTHVGYIVAFVEPSSVMAVFVALVAVVAVDAAIDVLQPKPVFVVQFRADPEVEHVPIASAVGAADPDVALPTMVFVACVASLDSATEPASIVFVTVPVSVL